MSTTQNYNFTTVPSATDMTVFEFRQAVAGEGGNFALLDSILASIDIAECSVTETVNDAGAQVYRLVFTHRNGSVLTADIPAASSGSSGSSGCIDLFVTCSVADQTLTHTYSQISEHIRNNGNVFLFDGSNIYLLDSESIRNNMGEMLSGWRFRRNYNTASSICTYFLTVWDNGSITSSSSVITPAMAENLTTEINENSTEEQFPSAKAVHNKLSEKADLDTVPNGAVMQGNTMKFQRSTVSNGATTTKNLFEVQIPTGGSSEGGTADGGGDGSLFPYIWKKYKGDPNTIAYTDGSGALYIAKRGYPTGNSTTVYYSDEINTGMGGISLADPVQIDIPVTQDGATTAAVLKGKYVTLGSNKNIYFIPEDARIIMAGSAPMYDIRATTYQTVEGAEFLGFVTAETSDAYPANGVDSTDGCWYVGGGLIADLTDISGKADKSDAETWTFTLADGSTVTKKVVLA